MTSHALALPLNNSCESLSEENHYLQIHLPRLFFKVLNLFTLSIKNRKWASVLLNCCCGTVSPVYSYMFVKIVPEQVHPRCWTVLLIRPSHVTGHSENVREGTWILMEEVPHLEIIININVEMEYADGGNLAELLAKRTSRYYRVFNIPHSNPLLF